MKWKIALIVAIVIGALGGSWIKNLPGFVIVAFDKTSYEMRLWVAVALILAFLSVLFLLGIFLRSILSSATKVKGWRGDRKWRKARKQTIEGMVAFVEGRWNKSENIMINSAKHSDTKLINYLIAAQSAQYQKSSERRDQYLQMADEAEPNAKVAIGLTQAQLQLDNEQYEQALATLSELNDKQANHPFIIKLLFLTHQKLQDWKAIVELLPQLKKHNVLDKQQLNDLEITSISGLLNKEAEKGKVELLENLWANLPVNYRKKAENILSYSQLLIKFKKMDEAEKLIKPLIKKEPIKDVIQIYGKINSTVISKQFTFLENWHNNHPKASDVIFFALGNIAYNASLWGKARYYFERSLRVNATAEGYFMMAKTLKKLEDDELSIECYRQGLEFVVSPQETSSNLLLEDQASRSTISNRIPKL